MKFYIWPLLLASFLHSSLSSAESCSVNEVNGKTVLSQYEFSWEIQGTGHQSGTFANGDCWIVGPVTIVEILPRSTNSGGRVRSGSQINPSSGDQGYDSSIGPIPYQANLNIAPSITGNALDVTSGSIVSTLSKDASGAKPQLESAAVLTVLQSAPPAGAFRPPYFGSDKTILGTVSDLDYSVLRKLPTPRSPVNICDVEARFERVWIEQNTSWAGRRIHPSRNMPDYGREMARLAGWGLQLLNLNFRDEDKELLLIRMVQYGIDVYGAAKGGRRWNNDGGHNHGRKMPLILAGLVLGNNQILEYADAGRHFIFQEDQQTFYVSQADVNRARYTADGRRRDPYTSADIGMPEWGEKHTGNPSRDGRNWDALYRHSNAPAWIGHVLAAEVMGAKDLWNHPPLFDYTERYYEIEKNNISGGPNNLNANEAALYEAYGAGRVPQQDPVSEPIPRPCGSGAGGQGEDCVFDTP